MKLQEERELRIQSTCQPPERLDFNSWAKEIRVSKIYDTGIFNDNLIYDEYVRKMKKFETPIHNSEVNKNKLVTFFNKFRFK